MVSLRQPEEEKRMLEPRQIKARIPFSLLMFAAGPPWVINLEALVTACNVDVVGKANFQMDDFCSAQECCDDG